jgi:formyltetrahydrofolate deformylase
VLCYSKRLDEGPIIERIYSSDSYSHSIEDFIVKGRDLERFFATNKTNSERKTYSLNKTSIHLIPSHEISSMVFL